MENVEKVCIEGAKVIRRMQVSGAFFLEFFSTCPVCRWMAVVRGDCALPAAPLPVLSLARADVQTLSGRLPRKYQNFFVFWLTCKKI